MSDDMCQTAEFIAEARLEDAIYAATYGARMAVVLDGAPSHEMYLLDKLLRSGVPRDEAMSQVHFEMQGWYSDKAVDAKDDARRAVELHRGE